MDTAEIKSPACSSSDISEPAKPAVAELNPALKPVVERHGQALVDFALRLAAANTAIDWMIAYSHTHSRVKPMVGTLIAAQSEIFNMLVAAKGWTWDSIIECMGDVDRAARLNQASPGPSGGN